MSAIVTASEIARAYTDDGFDVWPICLDTQYAVPSLKFIKGKFSESLLSFLDALRVRYYQVETNDCDNFAKNAWVHACNLHSGTPGRPPGGTAFGWMIYTRDDGVKHDLNTFLQWDDDGKLVPMFYEPQTQSLAKLSQTEKESCTFIFFA